MREVYSFPLRKKRIAVKVKKIGKNKFRVVPGVCVLEESTLVCEQPFFKLWEMMEKRYHPLEHFSGRQKLSTPITWLQIGFRL